MDEFGELALREREARRIARRQWFWLHFAVFAMVQIFLLAAPHVLRGWASVSARLASACLGRVEAGELRRGVARVLARDGEVDAFRILDALRLSLGSGPFLSATRVEAALLVLQDRGLVSARRDDGRVLYALASHPPLIAGD